jgi:aminopeptidase N
VATGKVIALVIAHEMAHMWFGNVVTMRWWDDLWLNEAFAEWMAHKACHAINPSYEVWNDFIEDKSRVLFDDALHSTHPIWTPVETPDEAIEMFDSITYQKGCAVMRMLEHFLGDEPFRDGLRAYMKEFQYGNACGPDLWRALEKAAASRCRR